MRTIWKRGAYLSLLTAGLAVAAVSCTDTATSPPSPGAGSLAAEKKLSDVRDKYGWTGDYHTRALEHAYREFKKHDARKLSAASKCKVAQAALSDFNKSYRVNGRPLTATGVSMEGTQCDKGVTKQIVAGAGTGRSPRTNEMSPVAGSLLTQVESVAESGASVAAVRAAIQDIQSTAAASLPEAEAGAVVAAGELAISSVEYWDANLPAWESEISGDPSVAYSRATTGLRLALIAGPIPGTLLRSGGPSRWRIVKADVGAFVAAVIVSWWTGPIGWEVSAVRGAAASIVAGMMP